MDQRVERKVDSPDSIEREAGREHERHGSDVVPRHDVHVHHHAVRVVSREDQLHKVLRRPQRLVRKLGARVREEAEQREKCRAMQQWRRLAEEEAGGIRLDEEDSVRLEHLDERPTHANQFHKPQTGASGRAGSITAGTAAANSSSANSLWVE